jgi:hypothetical protein
MDAGDIVIESDTITLTVWKISDARGCQQQDGQDPVDFCEEYVVVNGKSDVMVEVDLNLLM